MDKNFKKDNFFIGGEFFFSPRLLLTKPKCNIKRIFKENFPDKYLTYTYGGYYSLRIIIEHLQIKNNEFILLPSYLCPSILIPFKEYNIHYKFYRIKEDLSIDIDDLLNKYNKHTKAIFFINYFGFDISETEKQIFLKLKKEGAILIQDIVQDFYANKDSIIGNYAFNSFRKFFPSEGSVIISDDFISVKAKGFNKKYFFNKLLGRYYRYKYYYSNLNKARFLNAFEKANVSYYANKHIGWNRFDQYILNRINYCEDAKIRRTNYLFLLKIFYDIALFKDLPDNIVPLAFPIVINNRDEIRAKLKKSNIYCPIHWILTDEIVNNDFKESKNLSEKILSIPINKKLDYQKAILNLKIIINENQEENL